MIKRSSETLETLLTANDQDIQDYETLSDEAISIAPLGAEFNEVEYNNLHVYSGQ